MGEGRAVSGAVSGWSERQRLQDENRPFSGAVFCFSWSVGLVFLLSAAKVEQASPGPAEAPVLSRWPDPGYSLRGVG